MKQISSRVISIASLEILNGLIVLLLSTILGVSSIENFETYGSDSKEADISIFFMLSIFFAFSLPFCLALISGIGLLKFSKWARKLNLIISFYMVLLSCFCVIFAFQNIAFLAIPFICSLIFSLYKIWFFLRQDVKAYFEREQEGVKTEIGVYKNVEHYFLNRPFFIYRGVTGSYRRTPFLLIAFFLRGIIILLAGIVSTCASWHIISSTWSGGFLGWKDFLGRSFILIIITLVGTPISFCAVTAGILTLKQVIWPNKKID